MVEETGVAGKKPPPTCRKPVTWVVGDPTAIQIRPRRPLGREVFVKLSIEDELLTITISILFL